MLFDPKPKERIEDLYDREEILNKLKNDVNYPLTLLLGIRRSGKSSIVKVFKNIVDSIVIYVDLRKYEDRNYIYYRDLIEDMQNSINTLSNKLKNFFKNIQGISISGSEIKFKWSGTDKIRLVDILEKLSEISEKEKKVILIIDEAQELRKLKGYNLLSSLAYSYDNLKLSLILTSSEIGLMYRFLKIDDARSPLFGRAISETFIEPFDREKSIDFLRSGFEENKFKVKYEEIEDAYNNLGGIAGWLTYYGFYYLNLKDHKKALEKTIMQGVSLIKEEYRNFLLGKEVAKKRYDAIMKTCTNGCRWSDVKRALELKEGIKIDDKKINQLIKNLVDSSFLKKVNDHYEPADKLIKYAFLE